MANIEKGIVLEEYKIKKPSIDMVRIIYCAQAQQQNRLIRAEWDNAMGQIMASTTIDPSEPRTPKEIQRLANVVGGVNRLIIQEILPLGI